jgi:polar amino acid transport system substrate-binding protein
VSVRHIAISVAAVGVLASVVSARQDAPAPSRRTTKDGVYTKVQAEAGKADFEKICSKCHAFQPWEKSSLNPDLAGAEFLERWNNRSVLDLMTIIYTQMPNDGSAFLTEAQSADLAAYILQQNGFPVGQDTLKAGPAAGQITIVK